MRNLFYLFFILFFMNCNTEDKSISIEESKEEIKEELKIFPDTVREKDEKLNYEVFMLYPEFNPNDANVGALRKFSRGFLYNNKFKFLKFIKDFDPISTRYFLGDYIVTYQDEKMLSMLLKTEWQVPGTSRILYETRIINWDLEEQNSIKEKDYFIKEASYDAFKKIVDNKIKKKCDFIPEGIKYGFNFSEEDGLILDKTTASNPPACYGLSVIIPWIELENLLTEEGKLFLK